MNSTVSESQTPTLPGVIQLNQMPPLPLMVALQGAPGTGKTWSALTFPKPIVFDFDNKLGAHKERPDVKIIPFWDDRLIEELAGIMKFSPYRLVAKTIAIRRADILLAYIKTYGNNFTADSTLIIDSWTMVQNNLDECIDLSPKMNDKGKVDAFDFWKRKKAYSTQLLEALKTLPCNKVVTFHETADRDDEGTLTGKLCPLMEGKVKDQLGQHFNNWFRQIAETNKTTKQVEYLWQIRSDSICNCCVAVPKLVNNMNINRVPATYASLV